MLGMRSPRQDLTAFVDEVSCAWYGIAVSWSVFTVIETPVFSRKAGSLLSEDEREEFAAFISQSPTAGSVIRGSGGVRKIRWARVGGGKSGGVRVIY